MAWGILDRFMRPKWLLDRILLVAEHVAESGGEELPALLIDTLREHFGAQRVCIHFTDPGLLRPATRQVLVAACPATTANAKEDGADSAEAAFRQSALAQGKVVTASTSPAVIRHELRPHLKAVGARDAIAIPLSYRGNVYAVVNLYFKRTVPSEFAAAENVLRSIRLLGNLVYGVLLREYHESALQASDDVALAMAQAAAARDGYADGHVQRVCGLASALGTAAGLSRVEREAVRTGAMLRDIGKLHVPDYILQKPGPLEAAERACVHEHSLAGARMLLDAGNGFAQRSESLALTASAVRSHHERLDGSGYPDGLRGSDVPVLARIVAIVDVFAALTADRPFRAALPVPRAVQTLEEMAGSELDSDLVALFLTCELHTLAPSDSPAQSTQAAALGTARA